jgi:hypothetical protein
MRPAILAAFMFACFAVASAQQPLTNQDIIRMEKAGMSDQVILAAIGTQSHNFTLSTGDLIALKQAGVSDAVLAAMLKAGAPAPVPSAPSVAPAPAIKSITDVRTIFISGNNEAAANARNDLLKIASEHPDNACFRLSGVPKLADATLDISERDTAGGSGGIFGGTNLETTVASGTLTDAAGDLLWSNSKQGIQGVVHTGAGDAVKMLLWSLYVSSGCTVGGLRQVSAPQPALPENPLLKGLRRNSKEAMSAPGAHVLTHQEMLAVTQKGQGSVCAVLTVPPGAEIDIDGKKAGISPMGFLLLRKGTTPRVVTIKMSGYKTVEKKVVPDGKPIPIVLVLEKGSN